MGMHRFTGGNLAEILELIPARPGPPDQEALDYTLRGARSTLRRTERRPVDGTGCPGGLVYLLNTAYTVIVPDLHGRGNFLGRVMTEAPMGRRILDDLAGGRVNVICVGDAFHAEVRARDRWRKAYQEYISGYSKCPAMDEEMTENLGLLEMICRLQVAFPLHFHFLKGNHENVANEGVDGNRPFRKFAFEGEMVKQWILQKMGRRIFDQIYRWEKSLPLAAVGDRFLVTHSEPARDLTPTEVIDAYEEPDVVYSLTWTENGGADEGSVRATLDNFFPGIKEARIFGGHRPVPGRYSLRQGGRYVQVNTPNDWVITVFGDISGFDPDKHIIGLGEDG